MVGRPAPDEAAEEEPLDQRARSTGETDRRPTADRATDRDVHPSRRQSRRGFLGGMAGMGVGVGTATPGRVLENVETVLSEVESGERDLEPEQNDPHTEATFEAIIDAVVPNTTDDPIEGKFGEELDDIHQLGGRDSEMTALCIEILNDFVSPELAVPKVANTGETVPLSEALAAMLDAAASELIARGGNEEPPSQDRFGAAGGPFAALSRKDRFRALYDIEHRADQMGQYDDDHYSRTGSFVVALAVVFPPIIFYSDMNGYDDFIETPPSERDFDPAKYTQAPEGCETLIGWAQAGYPGVTAGHEALLGYELDEEFEATAYGRRGADGSPARRRSDESAGEAGDGDATDGGDDSGPVPVDPTDRFQGGGF